MPSITSILAASIFFAKSYPAATGTSGSALPWITWVGSLIRPSKEERSPSAAIATNWRAVPCGW